MKKYLILIPVIAAVFGLATLRVHTSPVFADSAQSEVQSGATAAGGNSSSPSINSVIGTVINVLSAVVGVIAVIMIIVAGFKYVTSGGDSNSVSSAKSTLVYAVVGLIIVGLAQTIVRFVLDKLL
jgi:beta-lactamase regulating signal transducer with metallopeptidase domain